MNSQSSEIPLSSVTDVKGPSYIPNQENLVLDFIPLTHSVDYSIKKLNSKEKISPWDFAKQLLQYHSTYAGGMAGKISEEPGPPSKQLKGVQEWVEELQRLFNKDKVQKLHTRLVILGLGRIDSDLQQFLDSTGLSTGLRNELKENFDDLLQVPLIQGLALAGYISDSVHEEATDHLSIEREVSNIAHVVTSRRVHPPLSLGLFGDWGSGKSFFMVKLRKEISAIANYYRQEEKTTGKLSEWCTRVVQIEFNAWHFSDANLWASFVTRIYDLLYQALSDQTPSDKVLREKLAQKVKLAEGVVKEAEAQLKEAESRVDTAADAFQKAQVRLKEQENTLKGLISDVGNLLKNDEKIRQDLNKAAKTLGYPEAAKSYTALEELNVNLRSFSTRLGVVTTHLIQSPSTLIILALLIIALPVSVAWLLEYFHVNLSTIGRHVAEISTFIFGLIAWLQVQTGRGLKLIKVVETGLAKAQSIRRKRLEEDQQVKQAKQELTKAQVEETAALQNLQQAQIELQKLKTDLQELKPERKLYRLIEERSQSATYSKHLGIISLIRTDFEKMSTLLAELALEQRDLLKEPPPIQRIILYIDDLDRCRPERVVEVLEAIHLLLAFPLFTVIVGVDPRWLRHSLSKNYPLTLARSEQANFNGKPTEPHFSTPQDYLEKIFQIPFALRPVEKKGYQSLVADLLKPLEEPVINKKELNTDNTRSNGHSQTIDNHKIGLEEGKFVRSDTTGISQTKSLVTAIELESEAKKKENFTPLNPRQLEFTEWEKKDIDLLWPLFRTPRTVKRFINTYRLLRAGVIEDIGYFEGTKEHPGEYQAALVLLAIVTSAPNETELFLQKLGEWLEKPILEEEEENKLWYWKDIIDVLHNPESSNEAWQEILDCLSKITNNNFKTGFTKGSLQHWALRVSRYSFSVRPDQVLS